MDCTLEIRTALGPEMNAWTWLNAKAVKRHSSCAAFVYFPTMIPLKMCPFNALQVLS